MEIQTNEQRYRHTEGQPYRQTDRYTQMNRDTDIHRGRHAGRQRYRQMNRDTDIQRGARQADRQTNEQRYRHTEGQTYRQTDRESAWQAGRLTLSDRER